MAQNDMGQAAYEPVKDRQVCRDEVIDARLLDLHHHVAAIGEPGRVNLADRGAAERLGIEGGEQVADRTQAPDNHRLDPVRGDRWDIVLELASSTR